MYIKKHFYNFRITKTCKKVNCNIVFVKGYSNLLKVPDCKLLMGKKVTYLRGKKG